jgi:hypothetical protein
MVIDSSSEQCPTVVRANCLVVSSSSEIKLTAAVQSCPALLSTTIAASQPDPAKPLRLARSVRKTDHATPINPVFRPSHAHRPRPHASSISGVRSTGAVKSSAARRKRKGKENETLEARGSAIGSNSGLGWHPLDSHLLCFRRRRRSLSLLASRLSHLRSEAVNASGSVRASVPGRLPDIHALLQTCRWVPSDCLLHFPNHYPLHCTARTPNLHLCALPLDFDLHTSSPHLLYHPFHLRATVTRPPETAINPFDETATLA